MDAWMHERRKEREKRFVPCDEDVAEGVKGQLISSSWSWKEWKAVRKIERLVEKNNEDGGKKSTQIKGVEKVINK